MQAVTQSNGFQAGRLPGGAVGALRGGTNAVVNGGTQWVAEVFGVDPNNPEDALVQLKNVGDRIISTIEAVWLAKKAGEFVSIAAGKEAGMIADAAKGIVRKVSKVAPASGGAIKMLSWLGGGDDSGTASFVSYLQIAGMFAMLSFAISMAFIMPMTPFILWVGGVMGWVVSVLEMVVAAPLLFAAHIHPEGEGMASKYGANGWMIVLEVFFKPVIMVISFFIASAFVDPMLRVFSALFFDSMKTVNADTMAGPVTAFAFIFLYVSFCVSLVNRSFSLITLIPRGVLRYVGGTLDNFTDQVTVAGDLEKSTKSGVGGSFEIIEKASSIRSADEAARAKAAQEEAKERDAHRAGTRGQDPV